MRLPLLLKRTTTRPRAGARGDLFRDRMPKPACHQCLDTGRVPFTDNHFALWMVPCTACRGRSGQAPSD